MNALELFRSGNDYIEIAAHLGTSEADISHAYQRSILLCDGSEAAA